MAKLKAHAYALVKPSREPPPWPRMWVCAFATSLPLLFGLFRQELASAIYAGLMGYLIALSDHLGHLTHRIFVCSLAWLFMVLAFAYGIFLHQHQTLYVLSMIFWTYGIGLMGGRGGEAEKISLYAYVLFVVAFYNSRIRIHEAQLVFPYACATLLSIYLAVISSHFVIKAKPLAYEKLWRSVRSVVTRELKHHEYALTFMVASLLAVFAVSQFRLERGYWTIVTVALVMKPDRKESIYRSFQRLIGTLIGVLFGEAIIVHTLRADLLIAGIAISAFLIPYAQKLNYTLVTFFVSTVVMFLLALPYLGHIDTHLPYVRVQATLVGCGISVIGVVLFAWIDRLKTQTEIH